MNRLWWLVGGLGLAGCGTIETGVRNGTDFLFGTPGGQQALDTATQVASGIPAPWNYVAVAVVSAFGGVGGWLYRRRLLKTDPATVT